MATIALRGMKFHSFHGYYAEEQSVGNNYEIDVSIVVDLAYAALNDDLANTINYEMIYQVCKTEMDKPRRLIESVALSILAVIRPKIGDHSKCIVCIRKLNPLVGGLVDHASFEIEG